MTTQVIPAVDPRCLYPKASAMVFIGGKHAWQQATARGLKVVRRGKRAYVRGSDLIAYLTGDDALTEAND